MKNKNLIIGLVVAAVVIGILLVAKPRIHPTLHLERFREAKPFAVKKPTKKVLPAPMAKVEKKVAQVPAKKAISKDKGALTVRIVDSKNKEIPLRIRAFKSIDSKHSAYAASLVANRMQEVLPGTYDIEIDTVPQTIYKNIRVLKGEENKADLGSITGSINIKALNAKKTAATYQVRIFYSKSKDIVMAAASNRAVELLPGVYDAEIGTLPIQLRKEIKVEAGKEALLDLGCTTGTLIVKAVDEDKKEVRLNFRVTKSENNEPVTSAVTNRPVEILQGLYNIEVSSTPKQDKKDIKVNAGEDSPVEFVVQAPPAPPKPVPPTAAPAKKTRR